MNDFLPVPPTPNSEPYQYSWDDLSAEDLAYMQEKPRRRCIWCKRHPSDHHPECLEQLERWSEMPWGKWKGKSIYHVKTEYLEFVLGSRYGSHEHRKMFLDELQRRDPKYCSLEWEEKLEDRDGNHSEAGQ